ncbi:MFS transporter [Streptomyces hoynatensis]|uniref:MFS transporter n=1 Tax=Streptomyces hoynatensis TaxID=1141874 RepID=UPI001319C4DF|nr:MFS transporter [Streptomyces hoynatensis]
MPVLLLAACCVALAQTVVVTSLPLLQRQSEVSAATAAWLLTAFMLASAVVTPVAGRVGDLFGYRPVLTACLLCLAAGSALAAVAAHASWFGGMVAARVVQGCSGGAFPLAFGLARRLVPAARLGGVVAALSAMFGVGGALGMALGGPLADALGTDRLFWLLLLLAAAALAGVRTLPADAGTPAGRREGRPGVDLPGALLLAAALSALLLGITQGRAWGWGSARTLGLGAAAVLLGAAFALVERRAPAPLVDPALLRGRARAVTHLATLVVGAAMFSAVSLMPQFLQTPPAAGYGFGASATRTGLAVIPMAVAMVLAAPFAARLSARCGGRVTFGAGALLAALALGAMGTANGHLWEFTLEGTLLGVAYGLAFASLGQLVVASADRAHTGAATAINVILRTVGGAVGTQVSAVLVTASVPGGGGPPAESGYAAAFAVAAATALLALLLSRLMPAGAAATAPK